MVGILGRRRSAIGIAFDGGGFRAAQLTRSSGAWSLAVAARLPRQGSGAVPDHDELVQIRRMLQRNGMVGRRVVLAVPTDRLHTAVLELPPRSSGAPLEQIATNELARMHGFAPESAETICWDLPPSGRTKEMTQVMALACRHDAADALLDAFESAGLCVEALDSRLTALARAAEPALSRSGMATILDVSWDVVTLLLIHQDTIVYQRDIAEGGLGQLVQSVSERFALDKDAVDFVLYDIGLGSGSDPEVTASLEPAKALIRRHVEEVLEGLTSPLSYAMHQYPGARMEALLLTGQGASVPGLADALHSRLEVDVRTAVPADLLSCSPSLSKLSRDPSLILPIGLAEFTEW